MLKPNYQKTRKILLLLSCALGLTTVAAVWIFRPEPKLHPGLILLLMSNAMMIIGTIISIRKENKRQKAQRENYKQ